MNIQIIGKISFVCVVMLLCCSCDNSIKNGKHYFYKAIKDKDTALLHFVKLEDNRFFGDYVIKYGGAYKDSGEVRGIISGDTIKGSYYYHPYGGGILKRYPIALLKRKKKLLLGKGVISVYMGIPNFIKGEPIDYSHPEFIFEEDKK